uniref:Uncharacterized protein n=1 Tax=Odontella aurita TaxID=265563 RepID=A0A7S4NGH7_9STRA|mmetsp:Transcript_7053/g.21087  ORF Transcript_7053/g.21087 Transcript_7053/m.21087 type:complete len:108 (+) Transcript_7053:221-544(+)
MIRDGMPGSSNSGDFAKSISSILGEALAELEGPHSAALEDANRHMESERRRTRSKQKMMAPSLLEDYIRREREGNITRDLSSPFEPRTIVVQQLNRPRRRVIKSVSR